MFQNYLMKNYNREVRPVVNASTAVVVHVGITLTQIFDMVRKNNLDTLCHFHQYFTHNFYVHRSQKRKKTV
jgi:hypothetical protein